MTPVLEEALVALIREAEALVRDLRKQLKEK